MQVGAWCPAALLCCLVHYFLASLPIVYCFVQTKNRTFVFKLYFQPEQKPEGRCACQVGTLMAGTDKFLIRVTGISGHGGTPHLVKDSVVAGAAIVMNLQPLISRETDPAEGAIVGITLINSGVYLALVTLHQHMLKFSQRYLQHAGSPQPQ